MPNAYETVMESRRELVDQLAAEMEKGQLPWEKSWDGTAMCPHNPVSGVTYRGGNQLRLLLTSIVKRYGDNRWMTFQHAKSQGWSVRKGERGTLCEKWIFTKEELQEDPDTGKKEKVIVRLKHPKVSWFIVFNAKQIDGIPPEEKKELGYSEQIAIAERVIRSSVCPVIESKEEDSAYYNMLQDEIHLPSRNYFSDAEGFLATALHEMAHSTGAPNRLNRDMGGMFGSRNYAREELVAELSSVFTQADLGIRLEGRLQNHAAYLQSWAGALREDPNILFQVAGDAAAASGYLIERYEKFQEQEVIRKQTAKDRKAENRIEKRTGYEKKQEGPER